MGHEILPPVQNDIFKYTISNYHFIADVRRLVAAAKRVWDTVPSTYDEVDCRPHAAALTELPGAITAVERHLEVKNK